MGHIEGTLGLGIHTLPILIEHYKAVYVLCTLIVPSVHIVQFAYNHQLLNMHIPQKQIDGKCSDITGYTHVSDISLLNWLIYDDI